MIFTEPRFFIFFAVVWLAHWLMPWSVARKVLLLVASYAFYAAWDWRFLSLMLASTVVDYAAARFMGPVAEGVSPGRRRWLALSLVSNLGMLGVFKYFDFFSASAHDALVAAGVHVSRLTLDVTLPVGISFYTFQTLSYTIDVYRGKLESKRSFLDVALFVAFFPQLVAGPIVRAKDFFFQLEAPRRWSHVRVRRALSLFLVGFIKKACVADNLASMVDSYYAAPHLFDAKSAWIATLGYSIQIYCDFSGYSDMAIASAALLGYNLCHNFAFPYLSRDIQDFWRRWHISLSSWLRDYLYISLGGNRGTVLYRYRNLMLTMLLGGLWHGASWNFVVWGGLHGVALVAHQEWSKRLPGLPRSHVVYGWVSMALTYYWVCLAWIFFRAQGLPAALSVARAWLWFDGTGSNSLSLAWLGVFVALGLAHKLAQYVGSRALVERVSGWVFSPAYGLGWAAAVSFVPIETTPFIYFQF